MNKKILCVLVSAVVLFGSLGLLAGGGALAATSESESESTEVNVEFVNPVACNTLECIMNAIIDFIFWLALIIGPLVIIYGGFLFVTAGGDPKKLETGKKIIFWALIGVGVAVLAKGIAILVKSVLGVK